MLDPTSVVTMAKTTCKPNESSVCIQCFTGVRFCMCGTSAASVLPFSFVPMKTARAVGKSKVDDPFFTFVPTCDVLIVYLDGPELNVRGSSSTLHSCLSVIDFVHALHEQDEIRSLHTLFSIVVWDLSSPSVTSEFIRPLLPLTSVLKGLATAVIAPSALVRSPDASDAIGALLQRVCPVPGLWQPDGRLICPLSDLLRVFSITRKRTVRNRCVCEFCMSSLDRQ